MSKGYRELLDLIQMVKATPGWEVEEEAGYWKVHPTLSDDVVRVSQFVTSKTVTAAKLRTIGNDLAKAGWTREVAERAIREAAKKKTAAARARTDRKAAEIAKAAVLLGAPQKQAPKQVQVEVQPTLPMYDDQAEVIGDAAFLPPGPRGITTRYSVDRVLVSPELARKMLGFNIESNRNAVDSRVASIAGDIIGNRFVDNGGRILFAVLQDAKGNPVFRLIDGQKRLMACEKSGIPVVFDIVYNLGPDAFPTIDIQQSRSGANSLDMRGIPYAHVISSAIRVVWVYDEARAWNSAMSNALLNEWYDNDPQGWQSMARTVGKLMQRGKASRKMFAQRSVLGGYYICRRAWSTNVTRIDDVFNSILVGSNLPVGDPRLRLRLLLGQEHDRRVRKDPKRHLAMLLNAYNMAMGDPTTKKFTWNPGDQMPIPVHGK